ncbi:MAG TPA: hypothetical protein VFG58_01175 [Solirubrobacterales bacterium]|nr:hypothetical protein [Solirubrobacterales bacterium]
MELGSSSSGGYRGPRRRSRGGALAASLLALAATASLAACGGESSSNSNERAGTYHVKVVKAEFPPKQRLGETTLLRLGVRNTGRRALPALTVSISGGDKRSRNSWLPFGYRDPAPGIAQPDRPIWALAEGYPKLDGSKKPGGAETAEPKTFVFGPLKPGATTEAVWKLSAVKAGSYRLFYEVGAGLSDETRAKTANGADAGGSFTVQISDVPPEVEVRDNGEVVEIGKKSANSGR